MSFRRLQNDRMRNNLRKRSEITRTIRDFFWSQDFLEMETPHMVKVAGQEPYLSPFETNVIDERGEVYKAHLITSPEYSLKKIVSAGFPRIFEITKCFRNREQFGFLHNPEFTMLEWYRIDGDYSVLMDDIDKLLKFLYDHVGGLVTFDLPIQRLSMREAWENYCGLSLDDLLTVSTLKQCSIERGYAIQENEQFESLFNRIFLNEIEPNLGVATPTIVYDYPAEMASLSRLKSSDARYAERCELYIKGIEIANGFSELTDGVEQSKRLLEERELRRQLGNSVYDIDDDFVDAVSSLPPCTGIALGIDRLVMVLLGTQRIEDVIAFPADTLFRNK